MYDNREFMIFPTSELYKIEFDQVLETSEETVRKSVNGLKTFVKWEGDSIPDCLLGVIDSEGPYTYSEILSILSTPEWEFPDIIQ